MLFKKNNQAKNKKLNVEFKEFIRCRKSEIKEDPQYSIAKNHLSFDSESQKMIGKAIKYLIKKENQQGEVVLPGIVDKERGEVTLTFTNPRPNSKAIVNPHWPQIVHCDSRKVFPGNHAVVDDTVGNAYKEIFSKKKVKPTTHNQIVHKKINESNPQNARKITVVDLMKYLGFALTLSFYNNKLVVQIDGKSSGLNIIAPTIFEVMKEQKLTEIKQDQVIGLKNKIQQKLVKLAPCISIQDANKIKQLVTSSIDLALDACIKQKVQIIADCFNVESKETDNETKIHDSQGLFKAKNKLNPLKNIDKIINNDSNKVTQLIDLNDRVKLLVSQHIEQKQSVDTSQTGSNPLTNNMLAPK